MSSDHLAAAKSRKFARRRVFLYTASAIISLVGLADAVYLTAEHTSGRSVRCTLISGCSDVLSSPYASVGGVPVAAIGAAAYFTVFSLATLATFGYRFAARLLVPLALLMFLTTLWLLYLQAFVIRQFCEFCLLSAAVTVALMAIITMANWPREVQ